MDFSAQIAVIATFAALASAMGTMLTLFRLRRAEQANFFLEMTDRYNQAEMQEALSALTLGYKADPANFVKTWVADRRAGKPEALQLEAHRRRVGRYFADVARLHGAGMIDKRLAVLAVDFPGLNVWYQVAVPMSTAYAQRASRSAAIMEKVISQYGDGTIT